MPCKVFNDDKECRQVTASTSEKIIQTSQRHETKDDTLDVNYVCERYAAFLLGEMDGPILLEKIFVGASPEPYHFADNPIEYHATIIYRHLHEVNFDVFKQDDELIKDTVTFSINSTKKTPGGKHVYSINLL